MRVKKLFSADVAQSVEHEIGNFVVASASLAIGSCLKGGRSAVQICAQALYKISLRNFVEPDL